MLSDKSVKAKPSIAVCVEYRAVGSATSSLPIAETSGIATVREQRPTDEKSCNDKILLSIAVY